MRNIIEELEKLEGKYISIGISEEGTRYDAISVPWIHTAQAMNMKLPDIYLTEEEILSEEVQKKLKKAVVVGCYIFIPLTNYDFLYQLTDLWDLTIREGQNLTTLDFVKEMKSLFMLYLENVTLPNLYVLKPLMQHSVQRIMHLCLDLKNCHISCITGLTDDRSWFNELIVEETKGSEKQKKRWKKLRANTYRYFSLQK